MFKALIQSLILWLKGLFAKKEEAAAPSGGGLVQGAAQGNVLSQNEMKIEQVISFLYNRKGRYPSLPEVEMESGFRLTADEQRFAMMRGATQLKVVVPINEMTRAQYDEYLAQFVPSTRSLMPGYDYMMEEERKIRERAKDPAVSRAGFTLSAQNGYLVQNVVPVRTVYPFYLPRDTGMHTVTIFAEGGDEITHVNSQIAIGGARMRYVELPDVVMVAVDGNGATPGSIRLCVQLTQ